MKRTRVLLLFAHGFYVNLDEGTMNFQYMFLKVRPGTTLPAPA